MISLPSDFMAQSFGIVDWSMGVYRNHASNKIFAVSGIGGSWGQYWPVWPVSGNVETLNIFWTRYFREIFQVS